MVPHDKLNEKIEKLGDQISDIHIKVVKVETEIKTWKKWIIVTVSLVSAIVSFGASITEFSAFHTHAEHDNKIGANNADSH
jgi:hypothetical protein